MGGSYTQISPLLQGLKISPLSAFPALWAGSRAGSGVARCAVPGSGLTRYATSVVPLYFTLTSVPTAFVVS